MKIRINILLLALMITSLCSAQQEGIINQIAMNKMTLNAGYAGYRERPTFSLSHRQQWVGFEGAPRVSILSFDKACKINQLGLGGSLLQSRVGPTDKIELAGYTSVRTKLSAGGRISWGANVGMQVSQSNLQGLRASSDLSGQTDEVIANNEATQISPFVGFGMFYFNKKGYLSVSVPKLITTRPIIGRSETGSVTNANVRTVYIMGGAMKSINKNFKMNLDGYFLGTWNSPVTLGSMIRATFSEDFLFGVYYSYAQAAGAIVQLKIDRSIMVSYSLDLATNTLVRTNLGSHEIGINYSINSKIIRVIHPRYF